MNPDSILECESSFPECILGNKEDADEDDFVIAGNASTPLVTASEVEFVVELVVVLECIESIN